MRFFHHRLHADPRLHALHDHHHGAGRRGGHHHHGFFGVGGGPFGRGFPGGGPGGFGPGRKLGSGDLQLLLLALLAEKPSHGYELIKAVEERSKGYYTPSPGMVYPALTYLEEIGFATVQTEGTKKLYSITESGRVHLQENRAVVDTLLEQLAWLGRRMEHLRRAINPEEPGGEERFTEDAGGRGRHHGRRGEPPFEEEVQRKDGAPELQVARYDLKLALSEKAGGSREEQQRIAAILRRTAAEIRGT